MAMFQTITYVGRATLHVLTGRDGGPHSQADTYGGTIKAERFEIAHADGTVEVIEPAEGSRLAVWRMLNRNADAVADLILAGELDVDDEGNLPEDGTFTIPETAGERKSSTKVGAAAFLASRGKAPASATAAAEAPAPEASPEAATAASEASQAKRGRRG